MDENIILPAIEDYSDYTKAQKKMLHTLVKISIDGVAHADIDYFIKTVGITRPTAYIILKKLENDGLITSVRLEGKRKNSYQINYKNFESLVKIYNKKHNL